MSSTCTFLYPTRSRSRISYSHHYHHEASLILKSRRGTKSSSAAKAPSTTYTLLQLLHLDHFGSVDALDDKLSNSVALLDRVVCLGVVEQQHLHLAAVVCVNDAGAGVDEVLRRQA
jgi:hypothetical protein